MSRLKVWHNLANHHLNRAFLKDTLKKDLVCPKLVDFSFVETKGAPVVRKIPNGFNLVVVCLFSGSGRHSDLLTIDRRPSWSQRLFNPVHCSVGLEPVIDFCLWHFRFLSTFSDPIRNGKVLFNVRTAKCFTLSGIAALQKMSSKNDLFTKQKAFSWYRVKILCKSFFDSGSKYYVKVFDKTVCDQVNQEKVCTARLFFVKSSLNFLLFCYSAK